MFGGSAGGGGGLRQRRDAGQQQHGQAGPSHAWRTAHMAAGAGLAVVRRYGPSISLIC